MIAKLLKKIPFVALCGLFICLMIPCAKVNASTVKKDGYYNSTTYTAKYAKYIGEPYLKKVKLSGKKLTIYGSLFYHADENYSSTGAGEHYKLKAHKRTFKLTKKTKYYYMGPTTDFCNKRISKNTAYSLMNNTKEERSVVICVKNKKVTSIDISYIQ